MIEVVQSTFCPASDEHRLDPAREQYAPPTAATRASDLIYYFVYCQTCRNWYRVHAEQRWRVVGDPKRTLYRSGEEAEARRPRALSAPTGQEG